MFAVTSPGFVLFAAVLVSLAGVAFYFALFAVKKLLGRLTFWKGTGKFGAEAFTVTGIPRYWWRRPLKECVCLRGKWRMR